MTLRAYLLFPAFAVVGAMLAYQEPKGPTGNELFIDPAKPSYICKSQLAKFSPKGKWLAFEQVNFRNFPPLADLSWMTLISVDCLETGKGIEECGHYLTGEKGASILGWRPDETPLLRSANTLYAASVGTQGRRSLTLAKVMSLADSRPILTADLVSPAAEAAIEALQATTTKRSFTDTWTVAATAVFSGGQSVRIEENSKNWAVRVNDRNIAKETAYTSPFFDRLIVGDSVNDGLALESEGQLTSSILWSPSAVSQANFKVYPPQASTTYYNLHSSRRGDLSVQIEESIEGNRRYIFDLKNRQYTYECSPSQPNLNFGFHVAGTPDWPLMIQEVSLNRSDRGTVVVYLGGPGSNPFRPSLSSATQKWALAGYKVYIIAYSGSRGAGPVVANRLRTSGLAAILRDSAEVNRWLSNGRQNGPLIIYGESFGSVGAMALAKLSPAAKTILVVPLLKRKSYQDIAENAKVVALGTISPKTQRIFEQATIGDVDELYKSNMILSNLQITLDQARAFVAFAKDDIISEPSDLIIKRPYRIYSQGHISVTSGEQLWKDVFFWLSLQK